MITYELLQQYWWFLISLIGGLLTFLLFVQGGQSMLFSLARDEKERVTLINVLGRKWEYTFTTLVTFGGAFFASFPLFYSTSFGGAYWVWMIILFCFVLQAVSYEFQSRKGNLFGPNIYRLFLFLNGLLGTFLIGAAVATFFTGSLFTVNKANISDIVSPVISQWESPWHGLEALIEPRCWALGLAVFFLARTLACLFFVNRLQNEELSARSRSFMLKNAVPFVVFFLVFVIWTLFAKGFAVDPATKEVFMQPYKYLNNLIEMPVIGVLFLVGVCAVLFGIGKTFVSPAFKRGIWFAGAGTVITVCMLLLIAGFNNTAYYPSVFDLNSSLTIENSCSSFFTLKVMSVVSLFVPFVLVYIFWAWGVLERKPFDAKDMKDDGHIY